MQTLSRPAFAAVLMLLSASAQAQTEETKAPAAARQVLSTNPFGDLLTWFNVEYERTTGAETTWGISASVVESEYASAAALVRWYPAQTPLDGFYLGAHAGLYRFHDYARGMATFPGAGLDVGRAWRVGLKRRTSISLGFGLTRLAVGTSRAAPSVWPAPRFNVGVVF
jgi:hypothetical protein